jgi:hypothetical protein
MREIKFRQWNYPYKVWHYFEFTDGRCSGVINCTLSKYPIMQYTGLKDKNGKEIYEGDIVIYRNFIENGLIEYLYSSFYVKYELGWMILSTVKDIEIIGNIHENLELIK